MKKAIIFFVLTVVCWAISIGLTVRFVKTIAEETNASLAKVEAPGSAIFPIEEAGKVSLWHNYQDVHQGKTVNYDSALPSGFSFELKEMGSGAIAAYSPTFADTNMNAGQVAKKGLGTFEVTVPGDYELTVTAPPGESRIVSLSEGTMMGSFGKIFGIVGAAIALGFLGLIFLIIGIVMALVKSKSKPPLPAHAS